MKKILRKVLVLIAVAFLITTIASVLTAPSVLAEAGPPAEQATPVTIDLTAIVNAILLALAAFVTHKLIPYIKSKMTASQYAKFEAAVRVGVYAAEEIYRSGNGDRKLEYVKNYLQKKGYDVDIDQIKATVYQMRESGVIVNVESTEPQASERSADNPTDAEEDEDPQT